MFAFCKQKPPVKEESLVSEKSSVTSETVIIQGELENVEEVKKLSLKWYYLWALGISIALGGQYTGWNKAIAGGFGSALIAAFLVASAYWCLVLSIAELSSAIPFGGGSYGIARVTLGFFPGYMVAFMECSQSIIFVASAAVTFGEIITTITRISRHYEPLYWLFFFGTSLFTQICGGRTFWRMNMLVALGSLALILIYIFGCIKDCDFPKYAMLDREDPTEKWFSGGMMQFMKILPNLCWFYVGIECINLSCKDVPEPRVQVPRGYVTSMATLTATSFALLFCCSSLAPGIEFLRHETNPLRHEFEFLLNIHPGAASALALPSIYATCSGFMYCYGKQLKAMAKSGLVHPFFGRSYPGYTTPVNALVTGSILSYLLCLLIHFEPVLEGHHLFNISMLCAFTAYASQFASFVVFRYKFSTIKSEFRSPLGEAGAVYGWLVFTLAFLGICAFQDDVIAVSVFVGYCLVAVAYYFWAAQERQSFSEEEKQVMFRAYLMKSNNDRNNRIKRGKSAVLTAAKSISTLVVRNISAKAKYQPGTPQSTSAALADTRTPRSPLGNLYDDEEDRAVPFDVQSKKGSRRVVLLVDTGSGRIAISGDVDPSEVIDLTDKNITVEDLV